MARKRNGLVPIGEAFGGLDGPVKTIRKASPQALHHFTLSDQVNQLAEAREADPDLGFMARLMALCSMPRSNPGDRRKYVRRNGPYELIMNFWWENQAPLRQPAAPLASVGVHRSGAHPKPRAGSRSVALRIHAEAGHPYPKRRTGRGANAAPQPDEAALSLHCVAHLRR